MGFMIQLMAAYGAVRVCTWYLDSVMVYKVYESTCCFSAGVLELVRVLL